MVGSGITELGAKLGPINWQFMETKKFDAEDFEAFLALLPKAVDGTRLRHVVEVRHEASRRQNSSPWRANMASPSWWRTRSSFR